MPRPKKTIAAVHRQIVRVCHSRGLPAPSRGAVELRIARMDPLASTRAREGADGARPVQSAGGWVPPVRGVLEQVQIDHPVVDVIVVDEAHRLPIGRPYVTVGEECLPPVRPWTGDHVGGALGAVGGAVSGALGH